MFQNKDVIRILPPPSTVDYYPAWLHPSECKQLMLRLQQEVVWKQEPIVLFGKAVMQPRLTAWMADEEKTYRYSGITMQAQAFLPELILLKSKLEDLCGIRFNSALLNLYRHGNDSMGWHRDNEKELGPNPVIASLSLGAVREFQMRRYHDKGDKRKLMLEPGSLLIMSEQSQTYYEHQLPKMKQVVDTRINITFRTIVV